MSDPNAPGPYQPPDDPARGFHPPPEPQVSGPAGGSGEAPHGFAPPEAGPQPPSQQQAAPQYPPPPSAPMPPPPGGYDAGVVAPAGTYYDAAHELTLPEGTALASVGRRIGAYFLSIVLMIVTLVIGYVVWGLIAWGKGTTPALQVLGMRVWRPAESRPATFWQMVLREVVGRICDSILSWITLIVSFVMFLASKQHRSLHDVVASTVVLHDPSKVLPR